MGAPSPRDKEEHLGVPSAEKEEESRWRGKQRDQKTPLRTERVNKANHICGVKMQLYLFCNSQFLHLELIYILSTDESLAPDVHFTNFLNNRGFQLDGGEAELACYNPAGC